MSVPYQVHSRRCRRQLSGCNCRMASRRVTTMMSTTRGSLPVTHRGRIFSLPLQLPGQNHLLYSHTPYLYYQQYFTPPTFLPRNSPTLPPLLPAWPPRRQFPPDFRHLAFVAIFTNWLLPSHVPSLRAMRYMNQERASRSTHCPRGTATPMPICWFRVRGLLLVYILCRTRFCLAENQLPNKLSHLTNFGTGIYLSDWTDLTEGH
jgi:hypothetical protein